MLFEIDDNKTVGDLQERFKECFPGLSLAFYTHAHSWNHPSSPETEVSPQTNIGEISRKHLPGILEIHSSDKAGDVEVKLKKRFGLFVQVLYQKSGQWIQTGNEDDKTLAELSSIK